MAFVGMGFGLGVVAAFVAFLSGASAAVVVLAYIGTGMAVLLAALVSAMMFEDVSGKVEEDPLLVPHRKVNSGRPSIAQSGCCLNH